MSRRTVLRGLGAAVALPWLEVMGPLTSWAADVARPRRRRRTGWPSSTSPTARTWPTGRRRPRAPISSCPPSSNRSTPVKDDLLVLTGLTADKARDPRRRRRRPRPRPVGLPHRLPAAQDRRHRHPGRHQRRPGRRRPHRRPDAPGLAGDRRRARRHGRQLRLRLQLRLLLDHVLALGHAAAAQGGRSRSWSSSASSARSRDANRARRDQNRKSMLDFVREDADDLRTQARRQRPAQARRILRRRPRHRAAHRAGREAAAESKAPDFAQPTGIPAAYQEHVRLMCDLIVLAFQADVTRVCHVRAGQRGQQPAVPVRRRGRGASRPVAPRQQPEQEGQDPRDQPLPHDAAGLPADEAASRSARATARCWTTA